MFTNEADFQRPDWALLQNGAVNLFRREGPLVAAEEDLRALGYRVDPIVYGEMEAFRIDVSALLNWREQFGYDGWNGNLDALVDGFRSYPFGPTGRAAVTIRGFHRLVADDAGLAHALLDILEGQARNYLLKGRILIALIQTDDPDYHSGVIGGRGASWNRAEWLTANRR